jgi:hypothetical protein
MSDVTEITEGLDTMSTDLESKFLLVCNLYLRIMKPLACTMISNPMVMLIVTIMSSEFWMKTTL